MEADFKFRLRYRDKKWKLVIRSLKLLFCHIVMNNIFQKTHN